MTARPEWPPWRRRSIRVRVEAPGRPATRQPYWEEFAIPYKPQHNVISVPDGDPPQPGHRATASATTPVVWDASCLEEVCGACTMVINGHVRAGVHGAGRPARAADHARADDQVPGGARPVRRPQPHVRGAQARARLDPDRRHLRPRPRARASRRRRRSSRYALSRCMTCGCCLEVCPQVQRALDVHRRRRRSARRCSSTCTRPARMNKDERLDALMGEGGIADCGNAQNCVEVCPKEIPLTDGDRRASGAQTTRASAIKDLLQALRQHEHSRVPGERRSSGATASPVPDGQASRHAPRGGGDRAASSAVPVRREGADPRRRPRQGGRREGRARRRTRRAAFAQRAPRQDAGHAPDRARRAASCARCWSSRAATSRASSTSASSSTAASGRVAVMASTEGGVEIEEVAARDAREDPPRARSIRWSASRPIQARRLAFGLGLAEGAGRQGGRRSSAALARAFHRVRRSLVEINPLVVTKGGDLLALDAKIELRRQRALPPPRPARAAATPTRRTRARSRPRSSTSATSRSTATSAAW